MDNTFVSIIKAIYKFFCPFKMLSNMLKEQNEFLKGLEIRMLRLEIVNTIKHFPNEQSKIMALYDEYKAKGGNSYIDEIFNEWTRLTDKKPVKRRKKK